jgi:xylulokinase
VTLLGIDIGTTGLKAALYEPGGKCLATASAEWQAQCSGDRAEVCPDSLWSGVAAATREVTARYSIPKVQAIAISSHGESFVPMDEHGAPLSNFILNLDGRGAREMDEFAQQFGRTRLYEVTGLPPHPMYALPKILKFRKETPELFSRVHRFMCVEDYVLNRAGAGNCIDDSLASRTMGYDIRSGSWSEDLLAFAGVSSAQMSKTAPGGSAIGCATSAIASELKLSRNAIWASGGHDQACSSVGAGGLANGTVVDGTGTFECISVALDQPLLSSTALDAGIPTERHTVPEKFLSLAYSPGGVVLKWFRDNMFRDIVIDARRNGHDPYDDILATVPDEPSGIFVYPYLFGTGTPWLDSTARGGIVGLLHNTPRETLVRAALEGVTYEIRWNLELLRDLGVPIRRIVAVGGGAKSSSWLQLKADIFGCEVIAIPGEASCRGAAISAGVACGAYSSFEEGIQCAVPGGQSYEPRLAAQQRYDELFAEYKNIAGRIYGFKLPAFGGIAHA